MLGISGLGDGRKQSLSGEISVAKFDAGMPFVH